ncbi:hypothetical protein EYW49_08730 [Siculibacillus lacustris]|uniref:Glucosamine inositolphosphorylceramide transferase 1 N-terminal domain-containing protein n=1 Tax=Siculibacillus lacustris TaxID=1549641 RepID=A0A4Q9VSX2_9HYPH|nr:hypothetical protein [Siculibacillus lacustris]TBW38766.1 hypothetical protein EYW49_08730 [Siculibacillus lacustris]
MKLLLIVETARPRRWMADLAASLIARGHLVRCEGVTAPPPPALLAEVLELERLLVGRLRPSGADRVAPTTIAPPPDADFAPDLTLDLTRAPPEPGPANRLVLHADGLPGEDAAIAALTAGSTPLIEIVDTAGAVVERGLPSLEAAAGLRGGIEAVGARVATLVLAHVGAVAAGRARPIPPAIFAPARGLARSAGRALAQTLAATLVRSVYRLCCHAPHWRVGWRLHDGPGIAETGDLSGPLFQVLADPGPRFYADPFVATWEGRTALFVEDLDHRLGRGVVSAIPFDARGPSGPARPVLQEPWHLSYPFVFAHDGALWMIPESTGARDVALYRCTAFPDRWERVATLLDDLVLSDATIFEHAGRWWMFGTARDGGGGWSDTLSIHVAPSPFGPWRPHAVEAPLVDRTQARPAGAVFRRGDRLFRPAQDCSDGYGGALVLAEITRLDDDDFRQEVRAVLRPGRRWPGRRLHTLNRVGRLEVIDGSVLRPRSRLLARVVEARTRPRGEP